MTGKQLKNSILQWAIQGKLVPQDPNDEPASVLLEKIRQEKERLIKEKKIKRDKNASIIFRGEDNSYYEKFAATGEVKCIDEEIPFEIPQGWEWCKINNIAFVTKLAGFEYTKYISNNLQTTGIPLFKGKNVQGGKIVYDFEAFIPESLSDELERSQISKKCLLTPYVGTIGNIGIHNKPGKYHLGSNVGKIEILNPGGETCILEEFLHIYLLSNYGYAELTKYKKATAQESISIDAIREVLVPIPSIQKQKEIVDKYYELEPIVDKYNKSQDTLYRLNAEIFANLKKSILQEVIQGKLVPQIAEEGTARELLEQMRQEKQKLVKEGKLKKTALTDCIIYKGDDNRYYEKIDQQCKDITEEIPFEIPENWEWTRLSQIANIYTGNSIGETEKQSKFTDVIGRFYIGTKDVDFNNRINYDNGIAIPKQYETDFRLAPNNSILMCIEGGSAGRKIAILNQDVCFGNKLCCFAPFIGIGKYMFYYLQSPSFIELFNLNKTGIIGGVSIAKVKELLIPLPPLNEQQRIVAQIERLFEQLK